MAAPDPDKNTHEMPFPFNPFSSAMFSIVHDHEYEDTHYTFVTPEGARYRMPKDAIRLVCQRDPATPSQPPIGYGVLFEDQTDWLRYSDGYWHPWGADRNPDYDPELNPQTWDELWAIHGTSHWVVRMPIMPTQIPIIMEREGPMNTVVLPTMVEGEPSPGHVAWLEHDSTDFHIRDVARNVEVVVGADNFMIAAQMFVRTLWKRRAAEAAEVTVPDDVSSFEDTKTEE